MTAPDLSARTLADETVAPWDEDEVETSSPEPTPEEVELSLQALEKARRTQADLDMVNGYRQAVDFVKSLRRYGVPSEDVEMAVDNLNEVLCMALRNSA
ncbi:hypothetical protein [Streptomyces sp. NPDC088752]|uniref:hypothetical protein n=1 Tax=Streptomyces sp. NPDC088752 TaxID=3154963 RepID=UPI0034423256